MRPASPKAQTSQRQMHFSPIAEGKDREKSLRAANKPHPK
jgi:hypothetical protein